MDTQEFRSQLAAEWPGLSIDVRERVVEFRDWLLQENSLQNLTRLTTPKDFLEGHVVDVRELLKSGIAAFPAMDLGSGGGVPGLLAAIIQPDPWVLVDAEGRKAEFLARSVEKFGLQSHVQVFSGRGEAFLKGASVESVVARAVGPVERIYSWLCTCSTWNTLVLLKGPGWEAEWQNFQYGKFRRDLRIAKTYEYSVGEEGKRRIIVKLERVPRGTR